MIKSKRLWRENIYNSLITIENHLQKKSNQNQENNLIQSLIGPSKSIPCVFFYDANGSKLFEDITQLPEYYLTRTEKSILEKAIPRLMEKFKDVDIVEFGSGDCSKISIFLESIPNSYIDSISYIPLDVSIDAVEKSSNILINKFPGLQIKGIIADFQSQLDVIPHDKKKVFCLLGSTIGNFSMVEAQKFLTNLSKIMKSEDILLIGFDMVKEKEIIEKAYNDSKKITEKFNKNILNAVNELICTDFNQDDFDHVAFFNEEESRIEMHLRAKKDLEIYSSCYDIKLQINKDESIHTENSYKFTEKNIEELALYSGLEIENIFTDENKWFSLVQLIKNNGD